MGQCFRSRWCTGGLELQATGPHLQLRLARLPLARARHRDLHRSQQRRPFDDLVQQRSVRAADLPVLRHAHDQLRERAAQHGEQVVDVRFPVADGPYLQVQREQRLGRVHHLQPAKALLLLDRACPPRMLLPQLRLRPRPHFLAQDPQRLPFRSHHQSRVQEDPAQPSVLQRSKARDPRPGAEVQGRRVLEHEHALQSPCALDRRSRVGDADLLRAHLLRAQRAIGRFDVRGGAAGLRDRGARIGRELFHDPDHSTIPSRIPQIQRPHLRFSPPHPPPTSQVTRSPFARPSYPDASIRSRLVGNG